MIDKKAVFNNSLFIKDQKNDKRFYKDFTSTKIFHMFIQTSLSNANDKKGTYFQDTLEVFRCFKLKGFDMGYEYQKLYKIFQKKYISFLEIEKKYIIKPYFIKEFEKFEKNYILKNRKMKLYNVSLFLSKQYEENPYNYINAHGVLKENRRIINMQIELNNYNPPNIDIFIFPEHNKNTEISINNEISNIKRIIMGNISNNEYDLSEDEKNKIKQNIREIITRIYLSEASILEEDKKIF